MSYTILMPRGDKNYRLSFKAMQDGKLFLEDKTVRGNDDAARKNSRVIIWAQMGDPNDPQNQGPIDVTDWIVRLIQAHTQTWNANGHTPTNTGDIPIADQQQLASASPKDKKLRPHGATADPSGNRLAAYDAEGRLSTAYPVSYNHCVRKDTLDSAKAELAGNFNQELAKLRDWVSWIIGIDEGGNYIPAGEQDIGNSAVAAFNQISEIVRALNNDPNAFNTLMNAAIADKSELQGAIMDMRDSMTAMLAAHTTAATLDHPDGSVTADKLANQSVTADKINALAVTAAKLAGTLDLTDKTITVATPPLS